MNSLQKDWLDLGQKYCKEASVLLSIWTKIEKNYSEKNRYYHNLNHIKSMLKLADENKKEIYNFDELLFAIWFHDVIYKSRSKKNEEKSADFAKLTLDIFSIEKMKMDKIYQLIISTKKHQILIAENTDNAFLLDFDLSILGQDWEVYESYLQKIRKEYKLYPNFLYKPARKRVLESILSRKKIYFTEKYQYLFEGKARENLQKEIKNLS